MLKSFSLVIVFVAAISARVMADDSIEIGAADVASVSDIDNAVVEASIDVDVDGLVKASDKTDVAIEACCRHWGGNGGGYNYGCYNSCYSHCYSYSCCYQPTYFCYRPVTYYVPTYSYQCGCNYGCNYNYGYNQGGCNNYCGSQLYNWGCSQQ